VIGIMVVKQMTGKKKEKGSEDSDSENHIPKS